MIVTGITWQCASSALGAITGVTRMNVPGVSSDSGETIKTASNMQKFGIMVTRYLQAERNAGASVFLVVGDLWGIIWM